MEPVVALPAILPRATHGEVPPNLRLQLIRRALKIPQRSVP